MTTSTKLLYILGCKLVPHFNTYSNWREVRIVSHSDSGSTSSMHNIPTLPRSHPWDPSVTIRAADTANHDESKRYFFIFLANNLHTKRK